MNEQHRPSGRRGVAGVLATAIMLGACGGPGPTTTAPRPPDAPSTSPATPPAPATTPSGRIVIAAEGPVTTLSNAALDEPTIAALPFIFSGLYRLDASLAPVPDLASAPCDVSADAITWTCRLTPASFHDGQSLTADDVAYTYQLAMSPGCTFRPALCLADVLKRVRAENESTIVFTLREPYAPFATLVLSSIMIESRRALEGAFETVADDATRLDLVVVADLAGHLGRLARMDLPDFGACADAAGRAEELLARVPSLSPPNRDDFLVDAPPSEEIDACAYGQAFIPQLRALVAAPAAGVDAVAAAYALLPMNRAPIGSGPWRCAVDCLDAGMVTLTAFERYFRGPPAAATIVIRPMDTLAAQEALLAKEVDWVRRIDPNADTTAALVDAPEIGIATYPDLGYFSLQYNLRAGQLFAERGARKAVQHCINKPALVETATHGTGIPIESYLTPSSWAHDPDLPTVQRDTEAAMEHLRRDGWTVEDANADGIADAVATRDDRAFRTNVYVRAGRPDRVAFMEGLADQVIECGIELEVIEPHLPLLPLLTYPHILPGDEQSFDAYFGGWGPRMDPDARDIWHSSQCTTADQPETFNYICFDEPEADHLIEEGLRVADLGRRSEIYRDLQQLMYEEQPHLFAWTETVRDAFDARLASTAGELDLASPRWYWQLETLFIAGE